MNDTWSIYIGTAAYANDNLSSWHYTYSEKETALSQNADTLCMVGHHFSCMRRSVAYIYGAVSPYTIRCHHTMCMSAAYIYGTAHHVFSLAQTSLGHASSYTEATHYIDVIFVNLFQSLFTSALGYDKGTNP